MSAAARMLPARTGQGYRISIVIGDGWRIEGWVAADNEDAAKQIARNYIRDHYPQWVEEFKLL